jgi:hypothetical protein
VATVLTKEIRNVLASGYHRKFQRRLSFVVFTRKTQAATANAVKK